MRRDDATCTRPRWRAGAAACIALVCIAVRVPAAVAATDRLPDLIVRPELLQVTDIDRTTMPGRELLRLTAGAANIGTGPLEVRGGALLSPTTSEVMQRLYRSDGTWFDRLAGAFTYHPEHGHVHFDDWMIFRLREAPGEGAIGGVVAEGGKVSFCLLDGVVYDPTLPFFTPREAYAMCGFEVQGISPGWGDTYAWWLPDQWIDITGLADGDYWLEVEVDPANRLIEEDDSNNVARVPIRLRPPEAVPDRYEENDTFDAVAAREESGSDSPNLGRIDSRRRIETLSLEDEQDLFAFRFEAPVRPGAVVRVDSPWSAGDLDLELYDADRMPIAVSQGPSNDERIALDGLAAQGYFVRVFSRAGSNPEYALTIDQGAERCPTGPGGTIEDADSDGVADGCDNCPGLSNPGQADANRDGAGDACQPDLTLRGIVQDGGDRLEVRATARDPLGHALSGRLAISGPWRRPLEIHDILDAPDCGLAFRPDAGARGGIGFVYASTGEPYLFDVDSVMDCDDGTADYQIAAGACPQTLTGFDTVLALAGLVLPAPVCLRRTGVYAGGSTILIDAIDPHLLRASLDTWTDRLLDLPFEEALPRAVPLASMAGGSTYDLILEITNGITPPIDVRASFVYSGERVLVINTPPSAALTAPSVVECDRPGGGAVTLDAGGSTDPDSATGAADDRVRFEWFEAIGGPDEHFLGSGRRLDAILPLGAHRLAVRVTDSAGESDVAEAVVTIRDSVAPVLRLTARPATLWPPDHRLVPVGVLWQAEDRCDPFVRVRLESVTSSDPDDAPGAGDGSTIDDVQDALPGEPDASVLLRAERSGKGPGRSYTLGYSAVDASGNVGSAAAVVPVERP